VVVAAVAFSLIAVGEIPVEAESNAQKELQLVTRPFYVRMLMVVININ